MAPTSAAQPRKPRPARPRRPPRAPLASALRRAEAGLKTRLKFPRPVPAPSLNAAEGAAGEIAVAEPAIPSLAALLTRHILRDGELVLLILKPSWWFIAFASVRFAAIALILPIAAKLWMPHHTVRAAELGAFLLAGRVMWAVLQWMGRLYVLTDLRVVALRGVFNVDIFDCPLRKVAHVRLNPNLRERLFRLGTIEILPSDDDCPAGEWRTIRRPARVLAKIRQTVERAKQGGPPCPR